MKWIGYLLLAALILATITSPSEKKFEKFITEKFEKGTCKPLVIRQSYKVFSIYKAQECTRVGQISKLGTNEVVTINGGIPVYGKEVKYLGLFGRFWKL